jgi:hypothetical protein
MYASHVESDFVLQLPDEIQRAMAEELEDFPYNSVQQYAPNVNR